MIKENTKNYSDSKASKTKELGIYMDHSTAKLIDLRSEKNSYTITSEFTFETKEEALTRSENLMHNKRQQMQEEYYEKIAKVILKYDEVLLFGLTKAKTELYNFLNEDLRFKDIKISVEPADKLTVNQQDAFVRTFFEK
ncbi:hypothetical protein JBL43_15485 [Aureibaculum sp. A20]|uniref:Uncharacterized protein n=1 Tax=Aureibaculum flavum TaxID=2795986 RepID=A0ABS0WUI2_9FLAO|nr:hypothetical protein [Aureibaculum flavum]MBJ2175654.1 hypothetical protein [Aureibaculum flavum]